MSSALFSLGGALRELSAALPSGHERKYINDGAIGTGETIQEMANLASAGKRNFKIRILCGKLIKNCRPKDYRCYANAAFLFCRDKIKYVFDPSGVELVEAPEKILESGIADCDSICVLLASMFECMGFPARFVTIKADTARPDEFSHVYVETKIPRHGWIAADATMPHDFGWEPDPSFPKKRWPASMDAAEDHETDKMAGLSLACGSCGPMPLMGLGGMGEFLETDNAGNFSEEAIMRNTMCEACTPYMSAAGIAGMGSLGAEPAPGVITIIGDVIDGRYRNELLQLRDTQRERQGSLFNSLVKAKGNAAATAKINEGMRLNTEALNKTNEAINKYNEVLNAVQTYSFNQVSLTRLSGLGELGLAPPAIAAIAIAGGMTLAVLCTALAGLIRAAYGLEDKAKGYIAQIGDVVEATSGLVANTTIALAVVVGGYFLIQSLKKAGKI